MLETRPASNSYAGELVKQQKVSWQIPLWKGNMDQKNNILVGDVGESPRVQKMVRFFFQTIDH